MKCVKCMQEIPEGSTFCNLCGKKQVTAPKQRTHKRASGTGTISKDKRYKNPYIAHAPSTRYGSGRVYLGAYQTLREAQEAIDTYVKEGRPELFNATLGDIYKKWSDVHFKRVSEQAVRLYSSMWKRFSSVQDMRMRDIRTAHLQDIVNNATSKSACDTLKAMSVMLCRFAMENDIIHKNYAEFIKTPKFEKKEKSIFSKEEIAALWKHSDTESVRIVLFMIYTGFRIGEISKIKLADVHLKEGYIVGGEKTDAGKNRVVPLPSAIPELREFVRQWIKNARGEYLLPFTVNELRQEFDFALQKCSINTDGRKKLTPHSTRHTFASLSSAAGMQPENLQKIIGHSNYATTANVYIHQDLALLCSEMAKIKR